jgi:hypothetical protein
MKRNAVVRVEHSGTLRECTGVAAIVAILFAGGAVAGGQRGESASWSDMPRILKGIADTGKQAAEIRIGRARDALVDKVTAGSGMSDEDRRRARRLAKHAQEAASDPDPRNASSHIDSLLNDITESGHSTATREVRGRACGGRYTVAAPRLSFDRVDGYVARRGRPEVLVCVRSTSAQPQSATVRYVFTSELGSEIEEEFGSRTSIQCDGNLLNLQFGIKTGGFGQGRVRVTLLDDSGRTVDSRSLDYPFASAD